MKPLFTRNPLARSPLVWAIYAITTLIITAIWTWAAQTQATPDLYSNIVANAEGRTPTPFVTRRLAADTGRLIARLVPASFWSGLAERIYRVEPLAKILNNSLNWTPADLPILASTTFVIGLSVFGFMLIARNLIDRFYRCEDWLSSVLALVMGFGLLTACGDHHYACYPYDYPNVFVFSLTFLGIVRNSWWTPLAFAMAAYSKETSALLILLFAVLQWHDRDSRYWLNLAILLITYGAVRWAISAVFVTPATERLAFWSARRNAVLVGRWLIYDFWIWIIYAMVAWRVSRTWHSLPKFLRLSVPVLMLLFLAAFFKGWLEERRQYLEMYPVFCLIVFHWIFTEFEWTASFSPRVERSQTGPASAGG